MGVLIGSHGRAGFVADVRRLVRREVEAQRLLDAAFADRLAVVEERDVAALGGAAIVVGELLRTWCVSSGVLSLSSSVYQFGSRKL
jgi:hypothetical protein